MSRRLLRRALVMSFLAVAVFGGTSRAAYLTTIGPKQCCTSHCKRKSKAVDAKRCCEIHLGGAPAPASTVVPNLAMPMLATLAQAEIVPVSLIGRLASFATVLDGRAPPGGSLLAQHSSLLL